jgi:hypothetical protein
MNYELGVLCEGSFVIIYPSFRGNTDEILCYVISQADKLNFIVMPRNEASA